MCGLAGIVSMPSVAGRVDQLAIAKAMAKAIHHRGPDAVGAWESREKGVALSHKRLAILDLSESGAQPMTSPDGSVVLAYNGEIYNHSELRQMLIDGGVEHRWAGSSDTETLLVAIQNLGIQQTLQFVRGMFAFAYYDHQQNRLWLGRDRFGEKPLYFGKSGSGDSGLFMFASELKALKVHPQFHPDVDRLSLQAFMQTMTVPDERSIYEGYQSIAPGHVLSLDCATHQHECWPFWSALDEADKAKADVAERRPVSSICNATDELETLLSEVVAGQSIADVPVGAFLSGGIDSSTIVALMQANRSTPVRTFSVGFDNPLYDESRHAAKIAKHLRTQHEEAKFLSSEIPDLVSNLADVYDEPFADSSQIPTLLVSQVACKSVKVALTGDGGDEIFAGYNRYRVAQKLNKIPQAVSGPLRRMMGGGLKVAGGALKGDIGKWICGSEQQTQLAEKMGKLSAVLGARGLDEFYSLVTANGWSPTSNIVLGSLPDGRSGLSRGVGDRDLLEGVQLADVLNYLPSDILKKVDRAAMWHSLETRVPFLDHKIFEFAWSLPVEMKLGSYHGRFVGKRVLRHLLERYVPRHLFERPKKGFGVPLDEWLRGPLRELAESLLDTSVIRQQGYLDASMVEAVWKDHKAGNRLVASKLWCVLMFQLWLRHDLARR